MDGMTLLREARSAGLSVWADGDRLVIRGPRRAEPVVRVLIAHKPEVMTALSLPPHTEAAWNIGQWSQLYREKLQVWLGSGRYTESEAEGLARAELKCRWHRLHGERVPASTCAGCGEPIADTEALDPGDGTRVHFATAGCLIRYGERWRSAATQALLAMGLTPPCGPEPGR
jgi:hypothetical protein